MYSEEMNGHRPGHTGNPNRQIVFKIIFSIQKEQHDS